MHTSRFAPSLAAALLTAGLLAVPVAASAAPTDTPASATDRNTTAELREAAVVGALGDRSAGSYLDSAGRLVVTVTDAGAEAQVRAAGLTPRRVRFSGAVLAGAAATLSDRVTTTGTAWAVDPVRNQVVVSADSTVTGSRLAAVRATVAGLGGTARLESVPGVLSLRISGGDAIYTGGARCSLGFNVRNAGTYFFLTAGHCTNIGATWTNGSTTLGNRYGSSFPGDDYGIVQYTTDAVPRDGTVGGQDITSAGTPTVNQTVTRRGSTTGVHSGRVTALNATVNYAEGRVSGLIGTTVCAEPGDSGGSLYQGTVAYGLTSGGSGNCSRGGVTYFQPVVEALSRYGVSVY